MSLSKLLVPLNIIQYSKRNVFKLQNCLSSTKCAEIGQLCPKPREAINLRRSRSERYAEALQKCPKTQNSKECAGGRSEDTQAKCPQRNAAELYRQVFAEVSRSAASLRTFARNSVDAIASSMRVAYSGRVDAEKSRIKGRLAEVNAKIDEIERMSLVCGACKRIESYGIGEWIHANFCTWECENESGARCVRCRLYELECRVKERTEMAIEIVTTCRGCVTPGDLIKSVDMSAKEAESILRTVDEYVRKEIANIEQLKVQILQENDKIVERLMRKFEKDVKEFVKQLDICIEELKKMQK